VDKRRKQQPKHERRAARTPRPTEPLLAFVHIPKTAGGTVTNMLASAYSKAAVHKAGNYMKGPDKTTRKVENWYRKGGRVSVGHVPYRVFRDHLPANTQYMTFLREPVDRVLSHYWRHIRRGPDRVPLEAGEPWNPEHGKAKADSIEQALEELQLPMLRNLATRFLCGDPDPWGELPDIAIYGAKANLRRFAFIGIQEEFEESVERLQTMLGVAVPREDYVNRHVSNDRPSVADISNEERALILEHNQLDAELYDFARELVAAQ
jgi:hypothetical protein